MAVNDRYCLIPKDRFTAINTAINILTSGNNLLHRRYKELAEICVQKTFSIFDINKYVDLKNSAESTLSGNNRAKKKFISQLAQQTVDSREVVGINTLLSTNLKSLKKIQKNLSEITSPYFEQILFVPRENTVPLFQAAALAAQGNLQLAIKYVSILDGMFSKLDQLTLLGESALRVSENPERYLVRFQEILNHPMFISDVGISKSFPILDIEDILGKSSIDDLLKKAILAGYTREMLLRKACEAAILIQARQLLGEQGKVTGRVPPVITSVSPNYGCENDLITIYGSLFGTDDPNNKSYVEIGGIRTLADTWNGTEITVRVPFGTNCCLGIRVFVPGRIEEIISPPPACGIPTPSVHVASNEFPFASGLPRVIDFRIDGHIQNEFGPNVDAEDINYWVKQNHVVTLDWIMCPDIPGSQFEIQAISYAGNSNTVYSIKSGVAKGSAVFTIPDLPQNTRLEFVASAVSKCDNKLLLRRR